MTMVARYSTKKELREAIGKELQFKETSLFGAEYPPGGNGSVTVVGPDEYTRKFFAKVTLQDHIITAVE